MSRQLRPNMSTHNDSHGGVSVTPTTPAYTIPDHVIGSPRPVRIITIGAGASGINLIRTLRNMLPAPFEHVVYEKNPAVGGTWFENRYPGCRCDIPSMNYQFSWKQKLDWINLCASAEEIQKYLCDIVEDEKMHDTIKLSHTIVDATWNETAAMWEVTIEHNGQQFVDKANFLIDASGILNKWKYPDVPNLSSISGSLIHTANWPANFSVTGKRVILIGNGASGVQLLPWVAENAGSLIHIIRSPTWILPPRVAMMRMGPLRALINKIEIDQNDDFSAEQIARFKKDKSLYDMFAQALEKDLQLKFAISLVENSPQEKWAAAKCREFMAAMLGGDEKLCKALIPGFPVSCKRLTPGPGYLEAFRDLNVRLVMESITGANEKGLVLESGEIVEADVIICATGFETSFRPPFPVVGRKGNLQDVWTKETPKSYMSLGVEDMPNFFKFLGPNAPISHGSVFTLSEHIATYIARAIAKSQTENIRSMAPSSAAVSDYHEHVNTFMPRTAWAGSCSSWYKHQNAPNGAVIGLHPGSRLHFIQMLATFRGEDWDFEYHGATTGQGRRKVNRFAYLGNGFTGEEEAALREMARVTMVGERAVVNAQAFTRGEGPGADPERRRL